MVYKPRNAELSRQSRLRLKLEVIERMGGKCVCCGEDEPQFLTINHRYSNGSKIRRQNNNMLSWREVKHSGYDLFKYELMCFNCNWSASRNGGVCIHQLKTKKTRPVKARPVKLHL